MPVETRKMEHELVTFVDGNKALFNDSAISHIEHSLSGKEFSLIGVSSHIKTHDLEWLILHCGGTITKRVTDNTDFAIVGSRVGDTMHEHTTVEELKIFKDALTVGVKMLTTLEFFQLIGAMNLMISIQNLVDGWHENITFSLRDTSAYSLTDRQMHKYSLEKATSNRSRCHGHCKSIIPKGEIRLKASFDPLTDSFVYFRCLKCITPTIINHIEKEWKVKGHGDSLLDFAKHQPDEVLTMFQTPNSDPAAAPPSATVGDLTPTMRMEWAQNLTNFMTNTAMSDKKGGVSEDGTTIPITGPGTESLGKRKRHETFSSAEIKDFMQSVPMTVDTSTSEVHEMSVKETITGGISPKIPTALTLH